MATASEPKDTASTANSAPTKSSELKPDTVQLCRFLDGSTAVDLLQETATYAKDPTAYLISALGQETFDARKDLLHIPSKVDFDVYGKGEHKQAFEQHIAKLLGKENGLFFLTGVQAQLAAMRIHCDRKGNRRVAWHVTSHLEEAEERAFETLYGLERTFLGSSPEALPTVEEIRALAEKPEDSRPAAMLVEIPNRTLGCATYSFAELETISKICKDAGVALHCDGARLWEIEAYYAETAGKTFKDIGALFDSIYVSFYKGLRGTAGAMLLANDPLFIGEAKVWQRRAGGNAFSLVHHVVDCERGYNVNIGTFNRKWDKMATIVKQVNEATKEHLNEKGGKIVNWFPEKPTCCQTRTRFAGFTAKELEAARDRLQEKTGVRVFERIQAKESLDSRLARQREAEAKGEKFDEKKGSDDAADTRLHEMEWMIMNVTEKIETHVFIESYVGLCEELIKGPKEN